MTSTANAELFEEFENDINFDCHSLRAKVSRSEAARQITAASPGILPELAKYLGIRSQQIDIGALAEIFHGWGILLSWICDEHSLDRNGIAQNDFCSWVKWLNNFSQIPAH